MSAKPLDKMTEEELWGVLHAAHLFLCPLPSDMAAFLVSTSADSYLRELIGHLESHLTHIPATEEEHGNTTATN